MVYMISMGLVGCVGLAIMARSWVRMLAKPRTGYRSGSAAMMWLMIALFVGVGIAVEFGAWMPVWLWACMLVIGNWLVTLSVAAWIGAEERSASITSSASTARSTGPQVSRKPTRRDYHHPIEYTAGGHSGYGDCGDSGSGSCGGDGGGGD